MRHFELFARKRICHRAKSDVADETAFDAFYDDIAGSIGGLSNVI